MEEDRNTFRYLIKIAGKVLFIIGLVLNILMIFFGFWPSFIYVLIMLTGAGMFSLNKNIKAKVPSLQPLSDYLKNFPRINIPKINYTTIGLFLKTVILTFLGLTLITSFTFWATRNYFKKRDTLNDCKEIITALNDFYKIQNRYPNSLSTIIHNNPLRQNWTHDQWNNKYYFKSTNNSKRFILISSGKDGKMNTKDDLIFKSN